MNVAEMMASGMRLELPDKLKKYIEDDLDTVCAITGDKIATGISWKRVIPSSTGEYLDLMHGMTFEYMSIPAATAYKGSWNMGSRLIFEDGTMYHPYIASSSAAKNERTYWSELVRDVWPGRKGQNCLCIITDDFKKKIWPRATVGGLGVNTPVLLYDSGRLILQVLTVNWKRLIAVLDFVEEVYSAGFSKSSMGESLYSHYSGFSENPEQAMEWETQLQELRQLPEFSVALLIAQKE